LNRLSFGAAAANVPGLPVQAGPAAEDQDRIHKVFNIDQENEQILVPYSGYSVDEPTTGAAGR
jgi:hypothetical protein